MTHHTSHWLSCSVSTLTLVGLACTAAAAQAATSDPPSATAEVGLEEVVVTAERRSEKLSDVPVAVTAFTPAELERSQIRDIHDLANNAPAVTLTATPYGNNDLLLSIRGVAPGGVLPNVDTAVGVYLDGVYYARPEGTNVALIDISSAEVLRGPQGTLFGRNTIGGALNITTNQPKDEFGGSVKLGYGNYNALTATGIVNTPLIDQKLDARFVVSHTAHDGYGEAANLGRPLSDQDDNYLRASFKANFSPSVSGTFMADYFTGDEHSSLWALTYLDPRIASPATFALVAPYLVRPGTRTISTDYDPARTSKTYDLTGTLTADMSWATLKSITGYRHLDFNFPTDSDGTPIRLLDYDFTLRGSQFSEELQLASPSDSRHLTWLTGLYYFDERMVNANYVYQTTSVSNIIITPNNESMSAFGQASYEILPKLRFTAGLRLVRDRRTISYPETRYSTTATPFPPATACPVLQAGLNQVPGGCDYTPPAITFNYVPWTVGLDYAPIADSLLYAKVSKGYRSGGFQQAGGVVASYYRPFNPENVLSEELGAKWTLWDRRLFVDGAVYHTAYNQIQQNNVQIINGVVVIGVFNAGKADIYGGELSATAQLKNLRIAAAAGLISPRFTEGPYKGTALPTVAKDTFSVRADYEIDLSSGVLDLHADCDYKSKVYFANLVNVSTGQLYTPNQIASFTQGGYGLVNAQISYTLSRPDVTIALWGKNLGDKYYAGRAGNTFSAGFNSTPVGDPRTYGVNAMYRFGT